MKLHETQKEAIRNWAHDPERNAPLVLCGQKGVGKSTCCFEALGSDISRITIYENEFFQFQELLDEGPSAPHADGAAGAGQCHLDSYITRIINRVSILLEESGYLLIENMNQCDGEHRRMLEQIQAYCRINNKKCNIVLSFNDDPEQAEAHRKQHGAYGSVAFDALDIETVSVFVRQSIASDAGKMEAAAISEKIALLASGSIGYVPLIFEALEKARILVKKQTGYKLAPGVHAEALPNRLVEIYGLQLELLSEKERRLLSYALPFGRDIHLNLFSQIVRERNLDAAYSGIAGSSILVDENRYRRPEILFDKSYRLSTEQARSAVENASSRELLDEFQRKVRQALFSKRDGNDGRFCLADPDGYIDRYELLRYLSDTSSGSIRQASREVVADLLGILFLGGYYVRVRDVARSYFVGSEERYRFAAVHEPLILDLYTESLYLMGEYEQVISISSKHGLRSRSSLICARAHYAIDDLGESRRWAEIAAAEEDTEGEAHLLLSSIANWEDDDKTSRREFALAMKCLGRPRADSGLRPIAKSVQERNGKYAQLVLRRDYLRYLPKKAGSLPDEVDALCRRLASHCDGRPCLSRVQAEILHNHGTDLIKRASTRDEGLTYLEEADGYFRMHCDGDRYCVQNSLAIAECLNEDFTSGLHMLEQLQPPPHSPFCVLAVRNNEIAALLALGDRRRAQERGERLFGYIKGLAASKGIATEGQSEQRVLIRLAQARADVKRQLKHYCLNRARMEVQEGLDVKWVQTARDISDAESSSNYLVEKCLYDHFCRKHVGLFGKGMRKPKEPAADSPDYWFFMHGIFLCEVMFWG